MSKCNDNYPTLEGIAMKKYIYFIFILAILLFFGGISYSMWSAKQAANKYLELAFNGKKKSCFQCAKKVDLQIA